MSSTAEAGGKTSDEALSPRRGATTLDPVHAAMLQAVGWANARCVLLRFEVERNRDFLRIADALSPIYAKGSGEKRLLDAMVLAVPR